MVRTHLRALILASVPMLATGCLTPQSDAVTGLISHAADATVVNSTGGDVYLAVDTAWESAPEVFERHGTCQVNTGDLVRQKRCTIRVPEGQLFFSKTKLVFGTGNAGLCKRVSFMPAVWQESNATVKVARTGGTPVCGAATLTDIPGHPGYPFGNLACFFGPARVLYSDWPTTSGAYFNPAFGASNESSQTIDSGNALRISNPLVIDGNWVSNLAVANKVDAVGATLTSPAGDAVYVGGTMQPYRARCLDTHEQVLAEVLVDIADEDLETGEDPGAFNNDQFYDFMQTL